MWQHAHRHTLTHTHDCSIRAVDLAHHTHDVVTLAGHTGERGHKDGAGKVATFNYPTAVAVDKHTGHV